MTKSFVACAVLLLRDANKLNLSDHVSVHGEFPSLLDLPQVTIFRLLSMGVGFPTDDPWADRLMDVDQTKFAEILSSVGRVCMEVSIFFFFLFFCFFFFLFVYFIGREFC